MKRKFDDLVRAGIVAALVAAAVAPLAGCGQRGPLYLPNPDAPGPSRTK